MSKIERAIKAYREAADAYEALPEELHQQLPIFNIPLNSPRNLRTEANWLETTVKSIREADDAPTE